MSRIASAFQTRPHLSPEAPATPPTLWSTLSPDAQRTIAAAYAGMMVRMRRSGPLTVPETPHAVHDAAP